MTNFAEMKSALLDEKIRQECAIKIILQEPLHNLSSSWFERAEIFEKRLKRISELINNKEKL